MQLLLRELTLFAGVPNDYPVFDSVEKCDTDVDVVIDFSTAKAVDGPSRLLCGEKTSGGPLYNGAFGGTA